MNPHTLSSRPIVVNGSSEIRVLIGEHNSTNPQVTFDGQIHLKTHPGDEVLIRKKPQHSTLIHPLSHNFYERCRSKLGWGGHLLESRWRTARPCRGTALSAMCTAGELGR